MFSFYKKEISNIRNELKKALANSDKQVVSVSAETLQFLLKTPLPNDRMIAAVKCALSKIEPNQTTARMKAVDARHICDWFDCCESCIESYGAMNMAVAMMLLFSSKNYRISVSRFFDDLRKATKALINQEEVTDTIGALPYRNRKEQVDRFRNGEIDVIVSTDAIGMGMNLPIRRVVFAQTKKFNGYCVSPLSGESVKQIAGRAGRYGMYDTGYVAILKNTGSTRVIKDGLQNSISAYSQAYVPFPEKMLSMKKWPSVENCIKTWLDVPYPACFTLFR